MLIQREFEPETPLTKEQLALIEEAKTASVVCDEECPELTDGEMKRLYLASEREHCATRQEKAEKQGVSDMSDFLKYKDFRGSIECSEEDDILFGKIVGIDDSVSYEGKNLTELEADFRDAVDDYLALCAEAGKAPQKEMGESETEEKAAERRAQTVENANKQIRKWKDFPPTCVAVIDVEATGTHASDECVQVSILRGDGMTLLDTLVRPLHHESWPEAEAVNHISPEDVKDAPTFEEIIPRIDEALSGIRLIVGYGLSGNVEILEKYGVVFPKGMYFQDVMTPFAAIFGDWSAQFKNWKRQKLAVCADHYGFDARRDAPSGITFHNSLFDCYATLYCFRRMMAAEREYKQKKDS